MKRLSPDNVFHFSHNNRQASMSNPFRAILFMFMNFKRQKNQIQFEEISSFRVIFYSWCVTRREKEWTEWKKKTKNLHIFEIVVFYCTEIDILCSLKHKKCIGHAKLICFFFSFCSIFFSRWCKFFSLNLPSAFCVENRKVILFLLN